MKRLNVKSWLIALAVVGGLSACDMMTEDLSDCPTGLYVNFVYDYNIQQADMFKDHVGGLTLYVYDESDRLVATRTMSEGEISRYGSYIHFSEEELAPDHSYRLMAVAFQHSQLSANGAKYRLTGNTAGSQWSQFFINLDHEPFTRSGNVTRSFNYVNNAEPLDTLWHTLTTITTPADMHPMQLHPQSLTPAKTEYTWLANGSGLNWQPNAKIKSNGQERVNVVKGEPTYATVSLIRDTNHLNVTLRALNYSENAGDYVIDDNQVLDKDYTVEIVDNNTQLDCHNNLTLPEDTIVYRPYRQWTTTFVGTDEVASESAAHYDLMFNRLLYKNASQQDDQYAVFNKEDIAKMKNAVLIIRKKDVKENDGIIFAINLPYILASGRTYVERYYHYQEYLDREYDYRLQFIIRGARIDEIQLFIGTHIHIIPWALRQQHETLN